MGRYYVDEACKRLAQEFMANLLGKGPSTIVMEYSIEPSVPLVVVARSYNIVVIDQGFANYLRRLGT